MKALLYPFSLLFQLIVSIRHGLFKLKILKSHSCPVPSICVGNITVGGTGKTPHIEYLIKILHNDYRIATLSRGYKRASQGFLLSDEKSSPSEIGDEPAQIKLQYPHIQVAVDEKRVRGVRMLMQQATAPNLILLDDAFQHRYIKAKVNILISDYQRPYWHDHLLPYGQLRDTRSQAQRANMIIISKCPLQLSKDEQQSIIKEIAPLDKQSVFFTGIRYKERLPLFNTKTEALNHSHVLLVTGIAQPQYLKQYLESVFASVTSLQFPDHHHFSPKDAHKIIHDFQAIKEDDKIIITSLKDAVKFLQAQLAKILKQAPVYYQSIEIEFIGEQEASRFKNELKKLL